MKSYPDPFLPDENFQDLIDRGVVQPIEPSGLARKVFADPTNSWVIKVAIRDHDVVSNWTEIVRYMCGVPATCMELGKILSWSQSGKYLVMEFLADLPPPNASGPTMPRSGLLPPFPDWYTDRKLSSLGTDALGVTKIRDYNIMKDPESRAEDPLQLGE